MPVLSPAQIASAAKAGGFAGVDVVTAVAIAMAESGGEAAQITNEPNGTKSYGLWQINSVHQQLLATGNWADPVSNAKMAFTLRQARGNWADWSTFNGGQYKKFLGAGMAAAGSPAAAPNVPTANPPAASATLVSTSTSTPASGGGNPVSQIVDALKFIADPHNWLRLAEFIGGAALLLVGLSMIFDLGGKVQSAQANVQAKAKQVASVAALAA